MWISMHDSVCSGHEHASINWCAFECIDIWVLISVYRYYRPPGEKILHKCPLHSCCQRGGGGGVWIGVYKSADLPKFEAKSTIRQWSRLNLNPLKAILWSNNPGSELNCNLNPQSEPKYLINPQSAVLIRSANPCKISARSKSEQFFLWNPTIRKPIHPPPPPVKVLLINVCFAHTNAEWLVLTFLMESFRGRNWLRSGTSNKWSILSMLNLSLKLQIKNF
jgi:hypothetical protein